MNIKEQPLRILYVEDNITDAGLIENFLKVSLPEFEIKYAKTEKEFLKFLLRFKPDVVLSGYNLEKYSAAEAFKLIQDEKFEVPLIIITNKLSEDVAGELIKKGIEDCIFKSNLGLLPAAIIKAIDKRSIRHEKSKVELELKNEQKRLETIFDNTPEAIINIGFKGEILEINPTGLQILQVAAKSNIKKKTIYNFIHPDDLRKFKKFYNSAGIGNKKTESFRIVGTKKTEHWVESSAVPLFDEDNHVISVLTINRDITDLVVANDKIEHSEEKFTQLTRNAPVGIFLTDERGDSTYVNERWCELTGMSEKNSMKNGWIKSIHPDDREKVFMEWYNCAHIGKEFRMTYRIQKPTGEINWIDGGAVPLRNHEGIVYGYIGTITDITEHKEFEHSVLENDHRLLAIQEMANIGYWDYIPDLEKGNWSKQIFKIHERDEVKGTPGFDVILTDVHPSDRSKLIGFKNDLIRTGEKLHSEFRLVVNKKIKYLIITGQAVKDYYQSGVMRLVGTVMDISKQKENEKKAQIVENKFLTLAKEAPVAIYQLDNSGNYELVNKKFLELFEMSDEEVKTDAWKKRIHPDDFNRFIKAREDSFGKPNPMEIYYRLFIQGRIKCVIGKSNPLFNESGEVIGRIGTILEVTEPHKSLQSMQIV